MAIATNGENTEVAHLVTRCSDADLVRLWAMATVPPMNGRRNDASTRESTESMGEEGGSMGEEGESMGEEGESMGEERESSVSTERNTLRRDPSLPHR